jgi:hypothetical protein
MAFTEEEIINGTTIIAKFMGYKVGPLSGWVTGTHEYYYKKEENGDIDEATPLSSGKFHKHWNALIPVWAKLLVEYKEKSILNIKDAHLITKETRERFSYRRIIYVSFQLNYIRIYR